MLIPERKRLEGVVGGNFDVTFLFWADEDDTVPFPVTEVVSFIADGVAVVDQTSGVTVAGNQVTVHLTPDQTGLADENPVRYRLAFGALPDIDYPVVGTIDFEKP